MDIFTIDGMFFVLVCLFLYFRFLYAFTVYASCEL